MGIKAYYSSLFDIQYQNGMKYLYIKAIFSFDLGLFRDILARRHLTRFFFYILKHRNRKYIDLNSQLSNLNLSAMYMCNYACLFYDFFKLHLFNISFFVKIQYLANGYRLPFSKTILSNCQICLYSTELCRTGNTKKGNKTDNLQTYFSSLF